VIKLNKYVFIVRVRINKYYDFLQKNIVANVDINKVTLKPTIYIDIKLDSLRSILRIILKYIN
jgi:hypothetical protein